MPLNQSNAKAAISQNIKLIVDEWTLSGKIGSSHLQNKWKAVQQAIALSTTDHGRKKPKP